MSKYQCVFDTPQNYPLSEDCYLQGCNPGLLRFLLSYLQQEEDNLTELYLCTPIYNNTFLHHALQKLAQRGVKVQITTRPIDSYANTPPKWIVDLADQQAAFDTAKTPYQIAREIFADLYKKPTENLRLQIFPHLAIRNVEGNPFAAGQQPYSLEVTAMLCLFRQGGSVLFSSSDLHVGSAVREGHLLLEENDWKLLQNTRRFFEELSRHAIEVQDFDFKSNYGDFEVPTLRLEQKLPVFFLAPFYHDSPSQAEAELIQRIRAAEQRVYVQSPITNCYEYEVDGHFHTRLEDELIEHFGFFRPVLERASIKVDVRFLTSSYPNGGKDITPVEDEKAFTEFVRISKATPSNQLATLPYLGSSFLILDDQLILSSSPFRPDVFVFLDQVRIQGFTEAETEGYNGIFSTTSFFWLVEEPEIVAAYRQHFEYQWERARLRWQKP